MFWYILCINILAFVLYGLDKWLAIKGFMRISEWTLLTISVFGGCYLALISMYLFHHKTKKMKFKIINIMAILLWSLILLN